MTVAAHKLMPELAPPAGVYFVVIEDMIQLQITDEYGAGMTAEMSIDQAKQIQSELEDKIKRITN